MKKLVIIESPGKIKKISSILGNDYIIKASFGHIRDLNSADLSIDIHNNFKPNYIISNDKKNVVNELIQLSKDHSVIIATDNDREGEGIAEGLKSVLKLNDYKRIVFTEITKNAIINALENPGKINKNLANAQETRRILDRLMGYLISPILWKYLDKDAKSAGRVQSVVNKIIIDKENEIKEYVPLLYYKISGFFSNSLNTQLDRINSIDSIDKVKEFLNCITKKTIFKIINIDNKTSIRKPPAPYITSTLQQDASTKLRFNPKKTMEIAQKLYESGLITYMRTDSFALSSDIKEECKEFILKEFGIKYSNPKDHTTKSKNAQEAHECIRPTHIYTNVDELKGDQSKLYKLIWERTIASQMSNAEIDILVIKIDAINDKSILVFDKQYYFTSSQETIKFDGYMKLNSIDSKGNEGIDSKGIEVNTILKMDKIKVSEEYSSSPLRYNEANLIKYLEKNGIGRPSTFASIITKVLERNYVEIKDIPGCAKEQHNIELSKTFKIKESVKEIIINSEKQKLIPTTIGININDFLSKHFANIINIEFTAKMEEYLDLIALGTANYITIIRGFYEMFNPTVEKLSAHAKLTKTILGSSNDTLFGTINDVDIYKGSGKFGPYIKMIENDKWKYISIKDNLNISIDSAYDLLVNKSKTFTVKGKQIHVKEGDYGPYIQIVSSTKRQNISIPPKFDIKTITIDDILQIIANKNSFVKK